MRSTRIVSAVVLVAALLVGSLTACGQPAPVSFEPSGRARTSAEVEAAAQTADLSSVAKIDVAHAAERRSQVLIWLRTQNATGKRAASLLTQGFPTQTAAVPVIVAVAPVDGVRSLIVVEASGDSSGLLRHRRLWVFDLASGRLLRSASYR